MLRRIVTGAAVAGLIGGMAYAQDQQGLTRDCERQLIATQALVQDRVEAGALNEAEQEAIYAILDNADALCADGYSEEANETLATVEEMLGGDR